MNAQDTLEPQDRPLLDFIRKLREELPPGSAAFRTAVENGLMPTVRRAMLRGQGPPVVLRSLSQAKDAGSRAVRQVAMHLADSILEYLEPSHQRETVVGA